MQRLTDSLKRMKLLEISIFVNNFDAVYQSYGYDAAFQEGAGLHRATCSLPKEAENRRVGVCGWNPHAN